LGIGVKVVGEAIIFTASSQKNKTSELKTQSRIFIGSYDEVYRIVMQTAASQNWKITHSDKDAGLVQAKTPKSLSSWDDEVSITMNEIDSGVKVQVKSGLANAPNVENVRKFLDAVVEQVPERK
jgi:hypothetical protein